MTPSYHAAATAVVERVSLCDTAAHRPGEAVVSESIPLKPPDRPSPGPSPSLALRRQRRVVPRRSDCYRLPVASSVFRSARLISVLTLLSRILGLVRDMACSYAFGVRGVWSAFSVAFLIPNLFRRLFGEGALSAASIPVLTTHLTREGPAAVDARAGRLVGALLLFLLILCLIAEAVVLGLYLFFGDNDTSALTLTLTAITLPYMILVCAAALLGGVENVFGRFAVPAALPIVLNLFMIASALGGKSLLPGGMRAEIHLLAFAVVAAGVAQLAWQWWAARRCGLRLRPALDLRDPGLRRVAYTMIPMTAGLGAIQLNTLTDSLIAMWFVTETFGDQHEPVGPAILYYAQRLYQFPLGVFATALATAIFPTLSRHVAEGNLPALGRTLARGLRVTTFEALPCLMGLILVREPLIRVLFGRGQFAEWPEAADRVGFALLMYALGIWAYAANQLIVRAFYALHDAKTPLKVSLLSVLLNLALNLILVQTPLREAGLALSSSICATLQVVALFALFNRRVAHVNWREVMGGIARIALATAAMAAAVILVDRLWAASQGSAVRLATLVAAGMLSFLAAAYTLRCQEIRELIRR